MDIDNKIVSLLSQKQVFGANKLDIFEKVPASSSATDFALLLGYNLAECKYSSQEDTSLKDRLNQYSFYSYEACDKCSGVDKNGYLKWFDTFDPFIGIRPVIFVFNKTLSSLFNLDNSLGFNVVEYGEYPQQVVSEEMNKTLNELYILKKLNKTGKTYTSIFKSKYANNNLGRSEDYDEYEYKGKKYVFTASITRNSYTLSNNTLAFYGRTWVSVSPIIWYADENTNMLISKNILLSGLCFKSNGNYDGHFEDTKLYNYLNNYFSKEIVSNNKEVNVIQEGSKLMLKSNTYGFSLSNVSEEDIIKGAIESDISVFLHGPSSEGKSARVKQIDPTCEIIYLRNATPESLNGKSVYNSSTGEMIDIPPTWYKKVLEKCKNEPSKYHIVFFDEITNALPSIQGMAFNIILDREVNGIWHLPHNARIVAAGNDMSDSLAANQLAEPLFNRFAHVYIKTTTENWLKWASENNIHPAIYAFILYTNGETLRSKYDGEKPNADPRKWEMASKMLYATNNPQMLRSLVGEEITKMFIEFSTQKVITIDDVINERYNMNDINVLNISQRYASILGLSQVDIVNFEKVRNFVYKIGAEFVPVFDLLWTHNDEERIEILQEVRLGNDEKKLVKKL